MKRIICSLWLLSVTVCIAQALEISDSQEEKNKASEKMEKILKEFSDTKNKNEKINILLNYADKFIEVPPQIAKRPFPEENEVKFCESGAYVWTKHQTDGTLKFYFAVENPQGISARALSVILNQSLSGENPETIVKIPDEFVLKIFGDDLLMGKNQGLIGIFKKVKNDAEKFIKK